MEQREFLLPVLLSMYGQMEQTARDIEQTVKNLSEKRETLRELVDEYTKKRDELITLELAAKGMTWCMRCDSIIPESTATLLFCEGREGNASDSVHDLRSHSHLGRYCPACRDFILNMHGHTGPHKDAFFHAFLVEKRDGGFYAKKFGEWIKLTGENGNVANDRKLHKWVASIFANEHGLPPRIDFLDLDTNDVKIRITNGHSEETKEIKLV